MKKINLFFLSVILVLGGFGNSNLAQAGCCINAGACYIPTGTNECMGEYDDRSCAEVKADGDCTVLTTTTSPPTPFVNPIESTSFEGILDSLLNSLMGLIIIVAVIFMVIGGIMYMTSAGNETMITRAKKTWTGAIVGLAIALATPTFLKQIKQILGTPAEDNFISDALTMKDIAINAAKFLLSAFGILAIIALIIGGGMYLTAYGDEKKIDTGKKIFTYAIIGIIVALSALVVVKQIANLISVS